MLIEDPRICESLRRIVSRLTADPMLREDLMQECLIRLWELESHEPGRTRSWYLQNCRFHLQHHLAAGRSVDSPKRAVGNNAAIDVDGEELPVALYHTNSKLFEWVIVRDIITALSGHLKPRESALLHGLARGLILHDIAVDLRISYPTALKYRRKIAALTVKLGISLPPGCKEPSSRRSTTLSLGRGRTPRRETT